MNVKAAMENAVSAHGLATPSSPVLLMVSGGSDSTALAYLASEMRSAGKLGPLATLHVNHKLRGSDADADEAFVRQLADLLGITFACARVDVAGIAGAERGNVEAIARRERYAAAREALAILCRNVGAPVSEGRVFVAHTADDRVENFYMRSIVGTGPGGFRSMRYLNAQVARPVLDCGRQELRDYVIARSVRELPVARDGEGMLWREDVTNGHTDRFRAYVRHEIVPRAAQRNPQLLETLVRSMNLIGDEDDMLDEWADDLVERCVVWLEPDARGCVLSPLLAAERVPMQRRVVVKVLGRLLGADVRVEAASVEALLAGFSGDRPKSGYVANVQGNLAVSANRNGIRVEPMEAFRIRRKRV